MGVDSVKEVFVVDGARTPFLKVAGKRNAHSASDLGVCCARSLLMRQPFSVQAIEAVVAGCVGPKPSEANIARLIALRVGCPYSVPAFTVQRNCASGLQALDSALKDIQLGRYELILAGGTEAMSHAPVVFQDSFIDWLAGFRRQKVFLKKLLQFLQFRPSFLKPNFSLLQALHDSSVGLNMGQTAEKLVHQFSLTRQALDTYALQSHQRALEAYEKGYYNEEIIPLYEVGGQGYEKDNGIRDRISFQQLSKLNPVFEKPFGKVTAGNSSQITDGAAFLILASKQAVEKYNLPVLGRIWQTHWAGLDPSVMGLGPVFAISKLLKAHELCIEDIDFWEINEAFSAQMLACLQAMGEDHFCQTYLDRSHAMGNIAPEKVNVDGGAIALGHPVGASGARIVLHLLHILKRNKAQKGIASLCIGGGQGGAVLLERLEKD